MPLRSFCAGKTHIALSHFLQWLLGAAAVVNLRFAVNEEPCEVCEVCTHCFLLTGGRGAPILKPSDWHDCHWIPHIPPSAVHSSHIRRETSK